MKELHVEMDGLPARVQSLRQRMAALLADFERCAALEKGMLLLKPIHPH